MSELRTVLYDPPAHMTSARLRNSADARAGLATATFRPNDTDSAYATVHVRYADGARVTVNIWIVNPAAGRSWRVLIGPSYFSGLARAGHQSLCQRPDRTSGCGH
jgi:hypothetical protein